MKQFKNVAIKGCPSCVGFDGRQVRRLSPGQQCTTCHGKTWLFDWFDMGEGNGWEHKPDVVKR